MTKLSRLLLTALAISALLGTARPGASKSASLFAPPNKNYQYVGRIDFAEPGKPRFWAPGVSITARFAGTSCTAVFEDEELGGKPQNYVEAVVDHNAPQRVKMTGRVDEIEVAKNLPPGIHTVVLCKDTEAVNGYLDFLGLRVQRLLSPPPLPAREIEFVGDPITCGYGNDTSDIPCHTGQWYDEHNAYKSYGAITARALNAQYHLTAVSGIGLIHSYGGAPILMPHVVDKTDLYPGIVQWDFSRYQPDAVVICLGQNDGIQDFDVFRHAYIGFVERMRSYYPNAQILCLSSPMAPPDLAAFQRKCLPRIVSDLHAMGERKVSFYCFPKSYNAGCDGHPDIEQDTEIAKLVTAQLRQILGWKAG